jgi:hypothetical protein
MTTIQTTPVERTPQQQANRWKTFVVCFGAVILGLVVAPVIFVAIFGLVGLTVALAIAAVVTLGGWALLPYAGMVAANWKIKLLKREASRNPVETMQNELKRRQELLEQFKQKIIVFGSKVKTFQDKVGSLKKQFPDDAPQFEESLGKMKQLYALRQQKFKDAEADIGEFEAEIEKANILWDVGQAAAAAGESAGMSDEDFYAKIKVKSSLNAIQDKLNMSFAQLDVALLTEKEPTLALPDKTITLDLPSSTNTGSKIENQ